MIPDRGGTDRLWTIQTAFRPCFTLIWTVIIVVQPFSATLVLQEPWGTRMLVMGQAWWSARPATSPALELVGPADGLHPSTEAILLHGVWHIRLVARAVQPLARAGDFDRAGDLATLHRQIEHHLARASDRHLDQSDRLSEVELAAAAAAEAIASFRPQAPRVQRTLDRLSRRLKDTEAGLKCGQRVAQSFFPLTEYGHDQGGPQIALETARVAALTAIDWLWPWSKEIPAEAPTLRDQVTRSRNEVSSDAARTLVSVLKRISDLAASASMPDDRRVQRYGLDRCVQFVVRWLWAPRARSLPRRDEGPPVKARLIKSSIQRRRQ